jgi:glycosyltransferase involved in cell wall biosynthesis
MEAAINGKVKDVEDLAENMEKMIKLTVEERRAMGKRGREKIVPKFDVKIVIKAYTDALAELFSVSKEE